MLRLLLVSITVLVISNAAHASNWVAISGQNGAAYVDMASVRRDSFPKLNVGGATNSVDGQPPMATYTVAWVATGDDPKTFTSKIEVAFDCHGKIGTLQQIILNETKDSLLHSFDQTQLFIRAGGNFRSIAPDSLYEGAEAMVCAPKKR
jgi:hypothetical protein